MMSVYCAICVAPIPSTAMIRREPLGKDDALVLVCDACAFEPVLIVPSKRSYRRDPISDRAAAIREHRDSLAAQGICINGQNHGKATNGQRCANCALRESRRNASRRQK